MADAFDWEAEGVRLGATLDGFHALLVIGTDVEATARVAIGIGRAQAGRRRVAVGDLLGEAAPIQSLVTSDDPHGIVDSFVYGVSLNRIASAVAGEPDLYVMPTGTEPVDAAEMFPNGRWRRLASGFREMGALLVLAARADAPGIEALAAQLDGAILVGDVVPRSLPVAAVVGSVRRPAPQSPAATTVVLPAGMTAVETLPTSRRLPPARMLQGIAAALVLAAVGVWVASRPFGSGRGPAPSKPDPTDTPAALIAGMSDSGGAAADSARVIPVVANPADSAQAAAYAVELLATNTLAGAAARVREEGGRVPASTFTPAIVDGAAWYKVVAGAYPTQPPADSLLAQLRQRGQLDERSGSVVRLPYAFLVHSAVAPANVQGLLNAYRDLGQPVYALLQPDGTLNVYAGAFESPAQATLLMESVRAAGITPTLVFRTGRVQ